MADVELKLQQAKFAGGELEVINRRLTEAVSSLGNLLYLYLIGRRST